MVILLADFLGTFISRCQSGRDGAWEPGRWIENNDLIDSAKQPTPLQPQKSLKIPNFQGSK